MQKAYLQNIFVILIGKDDVNTESDASSILKADLKQLQAKIALSLPRAKDAMIVYHLADLQSRIIDLLTTKSHS